MRRDRLLELDPTRPVLVLEAPAGYGKSALAQQWLDQRKAAGSTPAWVSLEAASRDPVVFLEQLLGALGVRVGTLRGASIEDGPGQAERFDQLCRRLRALGGASLVLDDCHWLADSASARYLERLLQLASPRLSLCLTMQPVRLAAGLGQLAAQGLVSWIYPAALSFTGAEICALAASRGSPLSSTQIDWVLESTGGWPSFVELALATLPDSGPGPAVARSGAVREYLCERFLDALDTGERDLLWIITSLDSAPVALLREVAGLGPRFDGLLQRLRAMGLIQDRDPRDDSVVRLHALMRDAVIAHVGPSQARDRGSLLQAAAAWYWRQGQGVEAVRAALDAGPDMQATARSWLGRIGRDLVFRLGQHQTLLDLTAACEAMSPVSDPALDEAAAWALIFQRRFPEASSRIDRVAAAPDEVFRASALLQRAALVGLRDEHEACGRLAGEWIRRHQGIHSFGMAVASTVAAFSFKCTDQAGAAQAALREAFYSFDLAQSAYGIGWVHVVGSLTLVHFGQYRAALAQIESGLQRCPHDQGFGSLRALLRAVEAFVRYERDELPAVEELLGDVIGLLAEQGVVDAIALGYTAAARLRGTRGELGVALDLLSEAEQIGLQRDFPRLLGLMHAQRALLLLRAGSTLRARALIDDIPPHGELGAAVSLLRARLALAEGDPAAALDLLDAVLVDARRTQRLAVQCEALLLRAHAEELRGGEAAALSALGQALDLAASEGYSRMLLDERHALGPLLLRWRDAPGVATAAARHLAARLAVAPDGGRADRADESRPVALNPRQREILSLLNQGLSNAQLARRCFLSESTVKWYLHNLYETFAVGNRTALLRAVRDRGIDL